MIEGCDTERAQRLGDRRTSWISRGIEQLIGCIGTEPPAGRPVDFDVVIVGSGYGGAIAADRLAGLSGLDGHTLRVCVLERGREYLPGAFPGRMAELGGHVRFTTPGATGAQGRLEGLFDLRVGTDMSVLLANGVGGGSLINAGVMEFASRAVFDQSAWPKALPAYAVLQQRAYRVREELGAGRQDLPNHIGPQTFGGTLDRVKFMQGLGGTPVAITVALADSHVTSGNVKLNKCIGCGDCATGCNHSAKDSLDVNLLRRAARQPGVSIFTGATVSRIQRVADAWEIHIWHTDAALRQRMKNAFRLRADKVILAAGALGSTEILMRSQADGLRFSRQLGRRFSGNGDVLAAVYDAARPIGGVADESTAPRARRTGPTITAMVEVRGPDGADFVVQDLGVPGPLQRLFEEACTTAKVLHELARPDRSPHGAAQSSTVAISRRTAMPEDAPKDPCAVDPDKIGRSVAIAMIGHDRAEGLVSVVPDDADLPTDAGVRIDWGDARDDPRIEQQHAWLARRIRVTGLGGQVLPNPMWRLLPEDMERMLGTRRGPLLSVHPLGGCPMGNDRDSGVVNANGEVFDRHHPNPTGVHAGLAVLDGAIVPVSLGINPALTIATLADAAIEQLARQWGFCKPRQQAARVQAQAPAPCAQTPQPRPVFRHVADPGTPRETKVQVVEQLSGWVRFERESTPLWVELSLVYDHAALFPRQPPAAAQAGVRQVPDLVAGHLLEVAADATLSRVRVFRTRGTKFPEKPRPDDQALLVAPLLGPDASGKPSGMRFFHHESSTFTERVRRAWWAWLRNRGLRDGWQGGAEWLGRLVRGERRSRAGLSVMGRLAQSLNLASRAGAVRLFDYDLALAPPTHAEGPFKGLAGKSGLRIAGRKRLTYERRGNPWRQLMRLELTAFPRLRSGTVQHLEVDPFYFARKHLPLVRVVEQQDQPSALADTLAFALYCARVLIDVHLWSFRKPDSTAGGHAPNRLPGRLPGLPAPQHQTFVPEGASEGAVRLTRYPGRTLLARRRPVLMIHGYSASGTTFAHPSLRPSLASHLWHRDFEPWIVDLRTSCGMPTATRPWTFEQIALTDIPQAVRRVCAQTGAERIDVVSHCMGSAMLAMTLLADDPIAHQTTDRIRRWVMSQVGPAVYFSPANLLRAYVVGYVRYLLPDLKYSLDPGGEVPGFDANLYDRLVASLPYLGDGHDSEFDIENPLLPWRRTPWVGRRHRLDALIGPTFDARRMRAATLDRIADFFGPISLATISQPIHFARLGFVSDDRGYDRWGATRLRRLSDLRMLSVHATDNGLADWETGLALRRLARQHGLNWRVRFLRNHGHQDCLIGQDCRETFSTICTFLS